METTQINGQREKQAELKNIAPASQKENHQQPHK